MPAGTYAVTVSRYGYATPSAQTVTVPPEHLWLNLTLGELPTIAGTVVTTTAARSGRVHHRRRQQQLLLRHRRRQRRLPATRPGTYRVSASKSGYLLHRQANGAVPPDRADVTSPFPVRYTIRGHVRDGGGRPLVARIHQPRNVRRIAANRSDRRLRAPTRSPWQPALSICARAIRTMRPWRYAR